MTHRPWTARELELLRAAYPDTPTAALAKSLGRTVKAVYAQAKAHGLSKSAAYLEGPHAFRLRRGDVGIGHRFKKGLIPWNKGMKGLDIGGKETRFKKGQISGRAAEHCRPIGDERVVDGYRQRKISNTGSKAQRWAMAHVLIWQEANGLLPDGHIVIFRDGNRENLALDNLECISRAENMRRNSYHNYPPEIVQAVQLRSLISKQINQRKQS